MKDEYEDIMRDVRKINIITRYGLMVENNTTKDRQSIYNELLDKYENKPDANMDVSLFHEKFGKRYEIPEINKELKNMQNFIMRYFIKKTSNLLWNWMLFFHNFVL